LRPCERLRIAVRTPKLPAGRPGGRRFPIDSPDASVTLSRVSSAERRSAPICNAPFSSLHLDPRGNVRACCQNVWQRLGNVGESSLREIWDGAATAELRKRLDQ